MTFQDRIGRRGLETEVLRRAQRAGVAGLTVFEAHEGFGQSGWLHESHLVSDDAPLAVVIVDSPEKVTAYLNAVADLLKSVPVVLEDVEIIDF